MKSLNAFQRVPLDSEPTDAVIVIIRSHDAQTMAEVDFPPYEEGSRMVWPAMGAPMPVPQALNLAIDIFVKLRNLGIAKRIAVAVEDISMWDDDWGSLLE